VATSVDTSINVFPNTAAKEQDDSEIIFYTAVHSQVTSPDKKAQSCTKKMPSFSWEGV